MKNLDISIIIPVYNASTTLLPCLRSIKKQNYPIKEIIVIDNNSSDNSVEIVENFRKKNREIPLRIFKQERNKGLIPSYSLGARQAICHYIIFMHSDSQLPTKEEIKKLVKPFIKNSRIVATYPKILHPLEVWEKYNFWEKLQFAQVVGKESPGLNGKFDCFKREVFLKIRDDWEKTFPNTDEAGGEDWYLHVRLKKEGKVVPTKAKVEHLHTLSESFTLRDFIRKRKHVSRSYGKLLKLFGWRLGLKGIFAFTFKPLLAMGILFPPIGTFAFFVLILFSFIYSKKMFLTPKTLFDYKILLLPFINIFLVYYESFWLIKSLLLTKNL